MKNKLISGCLAISALFCVSCKDFLVEDPKGQLFADTYFSSQSDVDAAVIALYRQVNISQIYTNMQGPQWQGDDITANPGSNKAPYAEIDVSNPANDNKHVVAAWQNHYTIIKAANSIINNIDKANITEENRNLAIGQAKFWRAYAYFYLVRCYGPLPLNLTNEVDGGTTPLTSVEEIYRTHIAAELEEVEALGMPTSYSTDPAHLFGVDNYITEQAVKSTLVAVYMAMAGYPLNLGTEYYAKAAAKAKEVIDGTNSGKYGITMDSDWANVYSMGNNYNTETILGINFSPNADWSSDSELTSCNVFESLGGWGDAWGEIKFWKEFPEGPRKDHTYDPQLRISDNNFVYWWATTDNKPYNGDNAVVAEYHPMMSIFSVNVDDSGNNIAAPYDYRLAPSGNMCNDHRHRLIRYPEVLLWYAESVGRSGSGDVGLANDCIRQVRQRACNPDIVNKATWVINGVEHTGTVGSLSGEALAEAALAEHGWEIAGYWVALVTRRADELRMNRLKDNFAYRVTNAPITVAVENGVTYTAKESVNATKTVWTDDMNYMPYPGTEVEKNPNLVRTDLLH